jgi:hypothetical protein
MKATRAIIYSTLADRLIDVSDKLIEWANNLNYAAWQLVGECKEAQKVEPDWYTPKAKEPMTHTAIRAGVGTLFDIAEKQHNREFRHTETWRENKAEEGYGKGAK